MTAPTPQPDPQPGPTPEPTPQPAPQAPAPEPKTVDDLPDWAQKIVRDARSEAATHRTGKQQAEADKQTTLDAIATALGVKEGQRTPDPEALTADLAAARAESWQRAVDLTVYRTASTHGADPAALLDSRSFSQRVADLDPDADDFASKVGEAIKAAISDNPKLAAQAQQRDMGQGRRQVAGSTGTQVGRELYEQRKKRPQTTS